MNRVATRSRRARQCPSSRKGSAMTVDTEEFDRLFDWYRTDAGFKAPEMLDAWYAVGCMGALAQLFPDAQPRRLKEGEYKRVFELLNAGDKGGMRAFLRGDA